MYTLAIVSSDRWEKDSYTIIWSSFQMNNMATLG